MSNANQFMGDSYELGLQIFSQSAVTAFRNSCVFYTSPDGNNESLPFPVIWQSSIANAVSEQFIQFNQYPEEPEEHTAGDELEGQQWEVVQDDIALDEKPLKAHKSISERDLIVAHFDTLGPLGAENGYALARLANQRLARLAVNAARSSALTSNGMTIHNGGNRVERVAASVAAAYPVSSTGARNFRDDLENLAQIQTEDDCPMQRLAIIPPYIKRVLTQNMEIFDIRYSRDQKNSLNGNIIGEIAGYQIACINGLLPDADVLTGPSKYQGYYEPGTSSNGQPACLAFCAGPGNGMNNKIRAAVGLLIAQGLTAKIDQSARKGDVMLINSLFMGADIMHPYMAGVIDVPTA